jgi:hypothetical protein
MTSSNKTDDSPIVYLTAGRTEQGSNAPREVAEMNRGYLRYSRKSTAPGNALQSIARSLSSVRRYFQSTVASTISAFRTKIVQALLLSALLYRGFNYLNRAWAALFSALEQNTGIPFITNQFIGVIEQTASRADRSGAIQEGTNSRLGR